MNPFNPEDSWQIGGKRLHSRLLIGTALYPSPAVMSDAIRASGAGIVTVSLRREAGGGQAGQAFWSLIRDLGLDVLPNTAGCKTAKDAITTAEMARELFETDWIKLEVIGDDYSLQPDPYGLVEAAEELNKRGFTVFPYTTDDLVVARNLVNAGCGILMPWGAPIGTGRGLMNPYALSNLRNAFPEIPLIVDAGIGKPSHAAMAMELGYDGILLNTAVAKATDPAAMGRAFRLAVEAGRAGYLAGCMPERDLASPSTPTLGTPFWHQAG